MIATQSLPDSNLTYILSKQNKELICDIAETSNLTYILSKPTDGVLFIDS